MSKSATIPKIRVAPEMKGRLERLAVDDGRSLTGYVRWVLAQHLKSVECLRELASDEAMVKISGLKRVSDKTVEVKIVKEWPNDETKRPNA